MRGVCGVIAVAVLMGSGCSPGTGAPPRPLTRLETLDIAEATFRYQFKDNASGQQQKAPAYFISLFEKDPTPQFLKQFAGQKPPVRMGSAFATGKGLKFSVTSIKQVNEHKVEVSGGYYEAGLSSSGNTYLLMKTDGKWKVIKNTMLWIS